MLKIKLFSKKIALSYLRILRKSIWSQIPLESNGVRMKEMFIKPDFNVLGRVVEPYFSELLWNRIRYVYYANKQISDLPHTKGMYYESI